MSPPRIVYLVTEDWYFVSHRLPMARAAREAGFDVHVATRVGRHGDAITREGFKLHPLGWRRGSLNPVAIAAAVREVRTLYARLDPDLVHHVAVQPTVVGGLAVRGLRAARVSALAGLGYVFTSPSARARAVRALLAPLLRRLSSARAAILVQNGDDRAMLTALGIDPAGIVLIRGSGVEIDRYAPLPDPDTSPPTVAVATRMLAIKGVATLVEASRLLRTRGVAHRLLLAGRPDANNPSSIREEKLRAWGREPGITWLGFCDDVRKVWAESHVAALTSLGGEGVPKTLLEAAASARPIVATDVPGCREIVVHGKNGLLVPPGDPEALAGALALLFADPALRRQYGAASRELVEREFTDRQIGLETVQLYRRLLASEARLDVVAP